MKKMTTHRSIVIEFKGAKLYVTGYSPVGETELDDVKIFYRDQDVTDLLEDLNLTEKIVEQAEIEIKHCLID
jgi:hypothetical protein